MAKIKLPPNTKKFIRLTPTRAKQYLKWNQFSGQRNQDSEYVGRIGSKLRDGLFHLANIALAHNGKSSYLMNGQQTCEAVKTTGVSCDAVLQEFQTKSKAELALVFAQFDTGRSRSPGNIAWAYCTAAGLDPNVPEGCVRLCSTALCILHDGIGRYSRANTTKEVRAERCVEHLDEIMWVAHILYPAGRTDTKKNRKASHMRRAQVVAAMMETYQSNKTEATRFWNRVRDGAKLQAKDPELRLRDWLRNLRGNIRNCINPRVAGISIVSAHEVLSRCIILWNERRGYEPERYKHGADLPEAM